MSFHIRPAKKEDVAFLLDSWMKSWRVNKFSGCIPNNEFYSVTRNNIENLVARGSKFRVAVLDKDEDAILGWICYEKLKSGDDCVHYMYVKDPYLKMGIGNKLADEVASTGFFSYHFHQVTDFFRKFKWAPEIARRKD
jgi:hypothetical protein